MLFIFIYMLFYGCNPDVRIICRDDLIFQVTKPQSTRTVRWSKDVSESPSGEILWCVVVDLGCWSGLYWLPLRPACIYSIYGNGVMSNFFMPSTRLIFKVSHVHGYAPGHRWKGWGRKDSNSTPPCHEFQIYIQLTRRKRIQKIASKVEKVPGWINVHVKWSDLKKKCSPLIVYHNISPTQSASSSRWFADELPGLVGCGLLPWRVVIKYCWWLKSQTTTWDV